MCTISLLTSSPKFKCVTSLHTKDANEAEPAYPHLKTLLQFDTRAFFNVLSLAFEEPDFDTEDGKEKRQRVVDILLQVHEFSDISD